MSGTQAYHIVAVPPNEWGHMRPIIAFVARLLALDAHITAVLIIAEAAVTKATAELSKELSSEGIESAHVRVKIVSAPIAMFWPADSYMDALKKVYDEVIAEKEPDLALLESMIHPFFTYVRQVATKPVKIAGWLPVALPSFSSMAPIRYIRDDPDAYVKQVQEIMQTEGLDYMSANSKAYLSHVNGRRIQIPGFPEMSDYEGFPQEPPVLLPVAMVVDWVFGIRDADILVTSTAHALERLGLAEFSKWLKKQPKAADVLAVGPLTSTRTPEVVRKEQEQADSTGLTAYLDRHLANKGAKSVLYVRGASPALPKLILFGVCRLALLRAPPRGHRDALRVLRVLITLDVPFVMVMSEAAQGALPPDLAAAGKARERAYFTSWAPQQWTLAHDAVGWFLSHCGINGTLESLCLRVPMLCWPLFADQPVLSILVSQVYGCGYELGEVRCGFGLEYRASTDRKPTGKIEDITKEATEVITKAFFNKEERAKIDANVDKMADTLNAAWSEGGEAREDALALLKFMKQ